MGNPEWSTQGGVEMASTATARSTGVALVVADRAVDVAERARDEGCRQFRAAQTGAQLLLAVLNCAELL